MISFEIAWCEALAGAAATAPDQVRSDAEIIEGFLGSGDNELFGVLVQRYKDRVFRLWQFQPSCWLKPVRMGDNQIMDNQPRELHDKKYFY